MLSPMALGTTSLSQATFVVVDLETTGASPKKGAALLRLAQLKLEVVSILETLNHL